MDFQKIIIGVGGNINSNDGSHPVQVARMAINSLKNYSIQVTKQSSWYETEPIPKSDQPNFFNCKVIAFPDLRFHFQISFINLSRPKSCFLIFFSFNCFSTTSCVAIPA